LIDANEAMDDRSPHPYDELQVDRFPFDEEEDRLRPDADEDIRSTGIFLKNKHKNSDTFQTSSTCKRQQHQQQQQQQHLDRHHVHFQTEESMKAFYMENKPSYTTASYLYPGDSAVATMEATGDTFPPVYSQLSFLQKPTHGRHAPCAVYAQPPNTHHQQQQHQLDRRHVYLQTEESMNAIYMEKTWSSTTASYLYPDSTSATMEASSCHQLSFLQTPTHAHNAVYAQPPMANQKIDVGAAVQTAPHQPAKETTMASREKPTSPSLPPITNLLHELTPDWKRYFSLPPPKDEYGEPKKPSQQAPSSSGPGFTSAQKETAEFHGNDSFVPAAKPKSTEPGHRSSSLSAGVLEILPQLSPVWRLAQLTSACHGGQPHHHGGDHSCCAVDDACQAAQSGDEETVDDKKDGLPFFVVEHDLPNRITTSATLNPPTPPPGTTTSVYPRRHIITTRATTMLTTSTTMIKNTSNMTHTTTANHSARTITQVKTWSSPQDHEEAQSQPPACPDKAPTPSPLLVVPMGPRPTRSISTPPTPSNHGHHRRRRGSSSSASHEPQRLDWSHRLNMSLMDVVAAAAAAAAAANNTQNESFTSDDAVY
jgi:hypothetical protein